MKKLSIVLIIGILIGLYFYHDYETITTIQDYQITKSINETEVIKEIDLNLSKANIYIERGEINSIQISRTTNAKRFGQVDYPSNFNDGKLAINEFYKKSEKVLDDSIDTVVIKVPQNVFTKNINIKTIEGNIYLQGLDIEDLSVDSKLSSEFDIESSKITNMKVSAQKINTQVSTTEFRKNILYNIGSGGIINKNVMGVNETINNKNELTYISENSFNISTEFNNNKVDVYYKLIKDKNYSFEEVNGISKGIINLKKDDLYNNTYNYTGNKTQEKNEVKLNKNKVNITIYKGAQNEKNIL